MFAQKAMNGVADGLLFGNPGQLMTQAIAVLTALVFSAVMSFILLKVVSAVFTLRANDEEQSIGIDVSGHGEEAYVHSGGSEATLG